MSAIKQTVIEAREQMTEILDAMTTGGIIKVMQDADRRRDDAADLVYMIAFDVLASRIGWEKAEEYSDNIMRGGGK